MSYSIHLFPKLARSVFTIGACFVVVSLFPSRADALDISGTVYKYSASPSNVLMGASVYARNLDPSQSGGWTSSGMGGTFTVTGISAGTYALDISYFPQSSNDPKDLVPPTNAPITLTNANSTGNNFIFQQALNTITGKVYKPDGTTIISGASVKIFSMNGVFYSVTTDSSGVYTQKVGSGDYMVKAEPGASSKTVYPGMPKQVRFDSNSGNGTSQTVDFVTVDALTTITGTFRTPTGGVPGQYDIFAMIHASGGFGEMLTIDSNGNFSINVSVGTHNIMVFPSYSNPSWAAPRQNPIVVTSADANTTKSLGTITMIVKTDKITGKVTDSSGNALAGADVMAIQTSQSSLSRGKFTMMGGENFVFTNTDPSGNYTLYVTSGTWSVRAMPPYGSSLSTPVVPSTPQTVTVTSGQAATANLTMTKADGTIIGEVVDANGAALTGVYGFVGVDNASMDMFGQGGQLMNGKFSFRVPSGTYILNVFLPPGSGYSTSASTSVTVSVNGTASLTGSNAIKLVENNATISGSIKDANGTTVTGKVAQMFCKDNAGNFAFGSVATTGTYSMKVAPGTWQCNLTIEALTGYIVENSVTSSVTATANQTSTLNFTVKATDSTISGTTKKADGTIVPGATIAVDSRTGLKTTGASMGLALTNTTTSDSSGNFTIKVPAETYKVRAFVPLSQGLINPKEEEVTVSASSPKTGLNLAFNTADATIIGTTQTVTSSATTTQPLSYVTAFSDKGGYSEALADASGNYTLNVTKGDTWHIYGIKESGQTIYKTSETVVTLDSYTTKATQNLDLQQLSTTMPKTVSTTCLSTNTCTLKLSDGATVTAPGGSLATSGNVTVTAQPIAQLPQNKNDRSVKPYGYNLVATDSNGRSLSVFNSPVTVSVPYTSTELTNVGVTAQDLIPKSWDSASGSYIPTQNVTVANNNIAFTTTHFSDFSMTAQTSSVSKVTISAPSTGAKVASATQQITGTVDDPAATVTITVGSTNVGSVSVNGTTGAFTTTVSLASGVNTITVSAKNVVGTGSAVVTVENILPTVSKVTPKSVSLTGKKKTAKLTITGTYFVANATVTVNGVKAKTVTVKDSATIDAEIELKKLKPSKGTIVVVNPDGGSVTATDIFTLKGHRPKVTSVAPSVVTSRKNGSATIVISGKNFVKGTKVLLDGKTKRTAKLLSSTKLRVVIPFSLLKKGKTVVLVIVSPDGQTATLKKAFKVK